MPSTCACRLMMCSSPSHDMSAPPSPGPVAVDGEDSQSPFRGMGLDLQQVILREVERGEDEEQEDSGSQHAQRGCAQEHLRSDGGGDPGEENMEEEQRY